MRIEHNLKFYECSICEHYHPWAWNGDCRDDLNRYHEDDLPIGARVFSMDDRTAADLGG